ncbi:MULTISPECIES: type I secretion system permease/ATPase [Methylobacterium]|jgi:ATP-binding cassette subfamily C protein|nr:MULTISPECIES: type I secretion system permease/ATPase [unclassified Methylobacterium]EIZ84291.1 type I secretion system ATPase [Methylobacterium sp. GXF4]MBP28050.1 type I secretion system permease/ATPase [Methylobacterium sp.]MBP32531.1 type I secretion system permease/ATPase [Methylobacterium sp.]
MSAVENSFGRTTGAGIGDGRVSLFRGAGAAFLGVGLLSALVNVLYLTGSLFMLEVYDRVLPSHSVPTLFGLGAIVVLLYAFQGLFDVLRNRLLVRIGASVDRALGRRTYDGVVQAPLVAPRQNDGLQPLRDLDQVRAFLSSPGPAALFDLPWIPLYLLLCFAFHLWIGTAVLAGALLLVAVTLATDLLTRAPSRAAAAAASQRNALAEAGRRNAEVLRAMGMAPRTAETWAQASEDQLVAQRRVSDIAGGLGAVTKVVRLTLQSLVLGIGAYLVIQGEATGGIMIASSVLVGRALAPVELAVAHWKGLVAARQGWGRLKRFLAPFQRRAVGVALPPPRSDIRAMAVTAAAPGMDRALVRDVTFSLRAGDGLGVVGASGSGKSSLVRVLVGIWPSRHGCIRLDGATLDQWTPEILGRHIGYLPQDVELFAGTVAQNIARFDPEAASEAIVAAARAAGVHELVCSLPEGYDTPIGEGGTFLSGGQRQRVALARALYGDPFLVVLDEPNSNLDAEGEEALTRAIRGVRARGGIVVIVAHRPSALAGIDHVLLMAEGQARAFGPKDEVLSALKRPPARGPSKQPRLPRVGANELAVGERPVALRVVADADPMREEEATA